MYKTEIGERRNPLILTDNVIERKSRDIDESLLENHLNKSLSAFVYLLIDKYFTAEGNESKWSGNESVRIGNITSAEQEMKEIERAFE